MQIFLVRHGIAVDIGDEVAALDGERGLSQRGLERTRAAARGAAAIGVQPDKIACSPLLRAQQTAEVFATVLGVATVETVDALAPDCDASDILRWVSKQTPEKALMLVGHMPNLSVLISVLVCGADEALVHLKKAGLCRLTLDDGILPGTATLDCLLPPSVLRRLAAPEPVLAAVDGSGSVPLHNAR